MLSQNIPGTSSTCSHSFICMAPTPTFFECYGKVNTINVFQITPHFSVRESVLHAGCCPSPSRRELVFLYVGPGRLQLGQTHASGTVFSNDGILFLREQAPLLPCYVFVLIFVFRVLICLANHMLKIMWVEHTALKYWWPQSLILNKIQAGRLSLTSRDSSCCHTETVGLWQQNT